MKGRTKPRVAVALTVVSPNQTWCYLESSHGSARSLQVVISELDVIRLNQILSVGSVMNIIRKPGA